MAGERRGTSAVAEFFKIVAESVQFSRFEPQQFIAQGDKVIALGHYTAKTSAGGSFDSDFVMVFTLRNGRVTEFQEFLDSAALNAAFVGDGHSVRRCSCQRIARRSQSVGDRLP